MFSDLFDPLIQIRYKYSPDSRQYHDTDITKLQFPFQSDNTFDINKYILSSRIRITRNLSGYTFPAFSTRAERRRVEGKLSKIFQEFNGNYYRLSAIDERLQETLVNVSAST
jgi:protein-arginine kinase